MAFIAYIYFMHIKQTHQQFVFLIETFCESNDNVKTKWPIVNANKPRKDVMKPTSTEVCKVTKKPEICKATVKTFTFIVVVNAYYKVAL